MRAQLPEVRVSGRSLSEVSAHLLCADRSSASVGVQWCVCAVRRVEGLDQLNNELLRCCGHFGCSHHWHVALGGARDASAFLSCTRLSALLHEDSQAVVGSEARRRQEGGWTRCETSPARHTLCRRRAGDSTAPGRYGPGKPLVPAAQQKFFEFFDFSDFLVSNRSV